MKIKVYVIDFETPRWLRQGLAYGVPVMVVLGVATVVVAAPVQWAAGETLTQAKMNAITMLTTDAGSYSVGATAYCGTTASSFTGAIGGYAGAKQACQTACSSLTAHMCRGDELVRSQSLGENIPQGWYSSGVAVPQPAPAALINDCNGWTTASSGLGGATWSGYQPSGQGCNVVAPILCCD